MSNLLRCGSRASSFFGRSIHHVPTRSFYGVRNGVLARNVVPLVAVRSPWMITTQQQQQQQRYYSDLGKMMKEGTQDPVVKKTNREILAILYTFKNVTLNQNPYKQQLEELRDRNVDMITKWQYMVQLLAKAKHAIIVQHGMKDMNQFKNALHKAIKQTRDGSELLEVHQQNWNEWINTVFPTVGSQLADKAPIPKTKMLRIVENLLEELTSETFLKDISPIVNSPSLSVSDKGRELLMEVSNRHQAIMEKAGFKDEMGYLECQRSMVVHFFGDEDINQLSHDVSAIVFKFTSRMVKPQENSYE